MHYLMVNQNPFNVLGYILFLKQILSLMASTFAIQINIVEKTCCYVEYSTILNCTLKHSILG